MEQGMRQSSSSTIFNDTEIILLFLEIYILYIVLFVSYVINCTFYHPFQVHGQLMIGLVVSVHVISILVPLMGQFTAQVPCHSADTPATFLYHSCLQKQAYISALWLIETGCWTYNYIFTTVAVAVITVACRQEAMALYFYSSIWWTFYRWQSTHPIDLLNRWTSQLCVHGLEVRNTFKHAIFTLVHTVKQSSLFTSRLSYEIMVTKKCTWKTFWKWPIQLERSTQ